MICYFAVALGQLASSSTLWADEIGEVSTAFKLIGPNHKVVVEAYDDPAASGVTCYVSRARTGGVKGAFGLAEDKAEAAIACRQVGPLHFAGPLPLQAEVFSERQSILFKRLRVVRMVDRSRNTLIYLSYSDKLIEGSPANSISAVAVPLTQPIPLR
jgi:CreA protein